MTKHTCFVCKTPIASEDLSDLYCHGCGEHICEKCSWNAPMGSHSAEDHLPTEHNG